MSDGAGRGADPVCSLYGYIFQMVQMVQMMHIFQMVGRKRGAHGSQRSEMSS